MPRAILAWLLSLVLAGCGSTPGPTATPISAIPTGSSTASPTASLAPSLAPAPSPSPSVAATVYPSTIGGMPVVAVPLAGVRVTRIADTPGVHPGGPPTGPYLYRATGSILGPPGALFVVDAGGGSERRVAVPFVGQEGIDATLVEGSWLVLLVSHRVGSIVPVPAVPCVGTEGEPIAWRILATTVGANGLPSVAWRVLDRGTARRAFRLPSAGESCDGPLLPPIALAAGRVVYGVEAPGAVRASIVIVRSVASGAVVRMYDVPNEVYQVSLSASTVAWSETTNALVDGPRPDWRVMTAPIAAGGPYVVPLGFVAGPHHLFPPNFLLDGSALVGSLDISGVWGTVVRIDGPTIQKIFAGTSQRGCDAAAADGDLVVLSCEDGSNGQAWIALWSASGGLRALGAPYATGGGDLQFDDPWMLYTGYDGVRNQFWLVALPVSSLR